MFDNIYILIPVYNEENQIRKVILELKEIFQNIIVVNDGSTDKTQEILDSTDVISLKHCINLGQGAAVCTGFKYIDKVNNAYALITFDADGQHSVEDAKAFATEIQNCDEDVIFGSRFEGKRENIPFLKKIVLSIVVLFTNKFSKTKLTDAHNGLKAIKTCCLREIDITIDGFGFESQIIHQVSKKGIKYKEMPTNTIYTEYSKNKGQKLVNGLIILEDLFKQGGKK